MIMRFDITTLLELVAYCLPLSDWSFVESAKTDSAIIYNSPWCRMKFLIEEDRTQDYLHVYYGRLHAADNTQIMKWKGENCYCWHNYPDIQLALEFLDGISPKDAYQHSGKPIPFFQSYYNSEFAKSIDDIYERALRLHAAIWNHYGLQFFELFDLRHPEIWERYIDFLKEFYAFDEQERLRVYKERGVLLEPHNPLRYKKC
jgi:hypothetical protein